MRILLDASFKGISPDWLKYGMPGLVVVLSLIFFQLYWKRINGAKGKDLFRLLLLFLVSVFAIFATGEGMDYYWKNETAELRQKVKILTGETTEMVALKTSVKLNQLKYDSLVKINDDLDSIIHTRDALINKNINGIARAIFDSYVNFDSDEDFSPNTPDLSYLFLRRVVFDNILPLNADKDILYKALKIFQKLTVYRISISDKVIERLVADFDKIMSIRYFWIKRVAIPQHEACKNNPLSRTACTENRHAQAQDPDDVFITLPKEIWIKSDYRAGENLPSETINSNSVYFLQRELGVIEAKRSQQ